MLALADHLKIERFYTLGVSGGGPYTLACVKELLRERQLGASVLGGLYPVALGTAGMMTVSRILFWVAPWSPSLVGFLADKAMGSLIRDPDPKVFENRVVQDLKSRPKKDQEALTDERFKGPFIEATKESLRQGGQGMGWEASIYGTPWGFELEEIGRDVSLTLWHAEADINVPCGMAKKAKERIPAATLKLIGDDEGHVSYFLNNQEEILRELLER